MRGVKDAAIPVPCDAATVVDDLIVARNPDPLSQLPYLVRIPLGSAGVVVKAKEPWPRTSKVYCHRADEWPADAEVLERHAVRSCSRLALAATIDDVDTIAPRLEAGTVPWGLTQRTTHGGPPVTPPRGNGAPRRPGSAHGR